MFVFQSRPGEKRLKFEMFRPARGNCILGLISRHTPAQILNPSQRGAGQVGLAGHQLYKAKCFAIKYLLTLSSASQPVPKLATTRTVHIALLRPGGTSGHSPPGSRYSPF